MDEFNFAIAAFAVVVGIGVTDIAHSLHRLLNAPVPIRWSVLPLAAAVYVGLVLSSIWFQLWVLRDIAEILSFWTLTGLLTQALMVYLAAAASLPDSPERDPDLSAYYWRRRRNIWIPMLFFSASMLWFTLYLSALLPNYPVTFWDWAWRIVPLPIYLALALSRSAWLHAAGIAALVALLIPRTIDWSL